LKGSSVEGGGGEGGFCEEREVVAVLRVDWIFSWIGLGAARDGYSESLGRRPGVVSFPSACCDEEAGEAGLPRRCWRLVGMPRAEARLLAMEELMSRGGNRCVACCCCCCCWER